MGWDVMFDYPRIKEIRSSADTIHPASTPASPVAGAYVLVVLDRCFGGKSWTEWHTPNPFAETTDPMPEDEEWTEFTRDYILWWRERYLSLALRAVTLIPGWTGAD
jgi:hypothetical protein